MKIIDGKRYSEKEFEALYNDYVCCPIEILSPDAVRLRERLIEIKAEDLTFKGLSVRERCDLINSEPLNGRVAYFIPVDE